MTTINGQQRSINFLNGPFLRVSAPGREIIPSIQTLVTSCQDPTFSDPLIGICTFHASSLSFTLYGSLFPLHFSLIYQMISLNLKSLSLFLY